MLSRDRERVIQCLDGIRVIMTLGIIYLHSHVFRILTPFRDESKFEAFAKTDWAATVSAFNIFVDSFFVISGALTTRSMLKNLNK